MTDVAIATEDELSEALCQKLVSEVGLRSFLQLRRGGNGYLRSRMDAFCKMAQNYPVIVLTDQDKTPCASHLISDWLKNKIVPENLLLRVAVREVEAWLLADDAAIRDHFGVNVRAPNIESIDDPKQFLLEAMRKSTRAIRNSLVDVRRGKAACGVGYNNELVNFVDEAWDPTRASLNSDSLARMRRRLFELAQRL